ncbi:MAG: septum formation family protein [Acidimicrobiia bacterium]
MTDDRGRSSSSEELLREARQRVLDGDLYSDDHLEPPEDDPGGSFDTEEDPYEPADDDALYAEDDGLSAVDIAEQLAEVREAEKPAVQADEVLPVSEAAEVEDRPSVGMSSLPDSAPDDDPATNGTREADSVSAPPSGSLSERIRALSGQQEHQSEVLEQPLQTPPPPAGERDPWSTPSEEWQSRPEPTPTRSSTMSWVKPVISLAVMAVFGFGFVAAQLDGSEPIDQLSIGDCFDPGSAAEVYTVPVVNCDELHEAELFGKVEIDALGAEFPGDDVIYEWVNARCEDQFFAYVGEEYAESRYWIEVFTPTANGWDDGDRTGLCTVVLVDENLDVRPALGTARNWGTGT